MCEGDLFAGDVVGTEGLLYVRGICWGDVLVKKEGGICYMG